MSNFQVFISPFDSSRSNSVESFIRNLDKRTQAKMRHGFKLLEEYGSRVGLPYVKKNRKTSLWELRIKSHLLVRFFYVQNEKEITILHGFIKRSSKTPSKELEIALHRLNNFRLR